MPPPPKALPASEADTWAFFAGEALAPLLFRIERPTDADLDRVAELAAKQADKLMVQWRRRHKGDR